MSQTDNSIFNADIWICVSVSTQVVLPELKKKYDALNQ